MNILYIILFLICWLSILRLYLKSNKSLINRDVSAEHFLRFIIEERYNTQEIVPKYKFFSEILKSLLEARKRFGSEIVHQVFELRKSLRVDMKAQKQIRDTVFGGGVQYFTICLLAYFFYFYSGSILSINLNLKHLYILIFIHTLGAVFYFFVTKVLQEHTLKAADLYISKFYLLRSQIFTSRSFSEVQQEFNFDLVSKKNNFQYLVNRAELILKQGRINGKIQKEDIDQLILETWDCYDLSIEKFKKYLNVLKLVLLVIFGLPSFFISLYQVLEQVNI